MKSKPVIKNIMKCTHTRRQAQAHTHTDRHTNRQTETHTLTHACTHTMTELLGGGGGAEERKEELLLIKILYEKISFQTSFEGRWRRAMTDSKRERIPGLYY